MRVLYLCSDHGIDPCGTKGASVHLRAITRALAGVGHEVGLLSPKPGPGPDHPTTSFVPDLPNATAKAARHLKHWLTNRGLDVSVAREFRSLLYSASAHDVAYQEISASPPDVIVERLSLFGHLGIDLAESLGVPLVLEVNAPLTEEATQYRSLNMVKLATAIEQRVYDRADAIAVVSQELADHLANGGVDRNKIRVIPNGVDLEAYSGPSTRDACRRELGVDEAFVVGFVGSLKLWHGVDVLLDAFEQMHGHVPSARLLIVGKGPAETGLRQQVADRGLSDAVVFTGAVAHERVPQLISAMDVAVAPFRNVENFYFSPIKLFEYMASGVCLVASKLGQIADVIQHGENGILFEPENVQQLHDTLEELRQSPETRANMGLAARAAVEQRFTWKRAAESLTEIMEFVRMDGRCESPDVTARKGLSSATRL